MCSTPPPLPPHPSIHPSMVYQNSYALAALSSINHCCKATRRDATNKDDPRTVIIHLNALTFAAIIKYTVTFNETNAHKWKSGSIEWIVVVTKGGGGAGSIGPEYCSYARRSQDLALTIRFNPSRVERETDYKKKKKLGKRKTKIEKLNKGKLLFEGCNIELNE